MTLDQHHEEAVNLPKGGAQGGAAHDRKRKHSSADAGRKPKKTSGNGVFFENLGSDEYPRQDSNL